MFALSKNDCVAELLPLMEEASEENNACVVSESDKPPLNLKETELSLGPPGYGREPPLTNLAKRGFDGAGKWVHEKEPDATLSSAKAQMVGWPPIRSFRKNTMASSASKSDEKDERRAGYDCLFVKVSMEGVPFLRKVDLKMYGSYSELSSALEKMFSGFNIGKCGNRGLHESVEKDLLGDSEYVLTYEDKDGDLMLVGDVPWE